MGIKDAERLVAVAERLGVKAHVQTTGRGRAVRFTGDHWHRNLSSAQWALLGEIPTPVSR